MTPAARLSAAIEVLDRIASSRQPADQVLKAWGTHNRYAGSKDRKAIADRVYLCLRERGGEGSGRRMVLASLKLDDGLPDGEIDALFSGQGHAPAALAEEEREWLHQLSGEARLPAFIQRELERAFGADWADEAAALLKTRAPLDIRVNVLLDDIDLIIGELTCDHIPVDRLTLSAVGMRLEGSLDLAALPSFRRGSVEVQDEGSQIGAFLAGSGRPQFVVDYCAGGGGKTLALAQFDPDRLVACDINPQRLDAIRPRLARSGRIADLRQLDSRGGGVEDLAGEADLVLVDAPCSGSGTWRRRPEEAWRLTEAEVQRLHAVQRDILDRASALVRPGGRLAYVTCSVLPAENTDVTTEFAAAHPDFSPFPITEAARTDLLTDFARERLAELSGGGHTVQLSPRRTGTDGFFIALFQRTS